MQRFKKEIQNLGLAHRGRKGADDHGKFVDVANRAATYAARMRASAVRSIADLGRDDGYSNRKYIVAHVQWLLATSRANGCRLPS